MRLAETGADQLTITVSTNIAAAQAVYLFAHTRNAIRVAIRQPMQARSGGGEATFTVDRKALGEGITHLTIFDASQRPVCERLYFKQPTALAISLATDQPQYASRSQVALEASVQAGSSTTNQTALSVAVYRLDSLSANRSGGILSSLWLSADLPGYIESPDYYLQPETPEIRAGNRQPDAYPRLATVSVDGCTW